MVQKADTILAAVLQSMKIQSRISRFVRICWDQTLAPVEEPLAFQSRLFICILWLPSIMWMKMHIVH